MKYDLKNKINELIKRQNIERGEVTEEVIMLRSISREQAKRYIYNKIRASMFIDNRYNDRKSRRNS
jgi:hypothetical protein